MQVSNLQVEQPRGEAPLVGVNDRSALASGANSTHRPAMSRPVSQST